MSKKIIISKSGYNALTETDVDNLVFSSDYNTLKYYAQGTKSVTTNKANYYYDAGSGVRYYHYTTGTVSHGLGYVPYFCGYFHLSSTTACQCPFAFGDAGYFIYIAVYADSSNLYFVDHFNSTDKTGTVTRDFSYRIFKNNLGL